MARQKKFEQEQVVEAVREAFQANEEQPVTTKQVAEQLQCSYATAKTYLNSCVGCGIKRVASSETAKRNIKWALTD